MYRPGTVAQRLAISPATLRQWSNEFGAFLSESARQTLTEAGTHGQRRYSDPDIAILHRAKTLLAGGLTYGQVRDALAQPPPEAPASADASEPPAPAEPPASEVPNMALAIIEQNRLAMASMQQTIEAQAAHVDTLQSQLEREQARADRAEREATELRRALLDQVQRPAPDRPPRRWWEFWRRDEN